MAGQRPRGLYPGTSATKWFARLRSVMLGAIAGCQIGAALELVLHCDTDVVQRDLCKSVWHATC